MKSYNNASFHSLQLVATYTIPPLYTHHATFLYIRRLYIISYENATGTFCYQNTQPMAKELHKAHRKNQKVLSECSVTKVQFSVGKNVGQKCERPTDAGYFRLW